MQPVCFQLEMWHIVHDRNTATKQRKSWRRMHQRSSKWSLDIESSFALRCSVCLKWFIYPFFSPFENTECLFWFLHSFSAYFNYLLIILFAILVSETLCSRMLYDTRQHQQTISFLQNPERMEELRVPSCVLSSPLTLALIAQRPVREKW